MANSYASDGKTAITVNTLKKMKQAGEKFVVLTVYDASFTTVLENAGVEVLLIGDSLGMVVQGHETTVPVHGSDGLPYLPGVPGTSTCAGYGRYAVYEFFRSTPCAG